MRGLGSRGFSSMMAPLTSRVPTHFRVYDGSSNFKSAYTF